MKCPHCGGAIPDRRQVLEKKLIELADGTPRSIGELMDLTGESLAMVRRERIVLAAAGYSLPLVRQSRNVGLAKRNRAIFEERERDGTIYRELGQRYGITTSRAREIWLREWRRRRALEGASELEAG